MPHPLQFESKTGRICIAWVWIREGTEKLVNGKQHSVWFVPTGMKGLPQNVLLNFRLEFPKSDLTIYLPSGISEIFCQMVSTPYLSFRTPFHQWHVIVKCHMSMGLHFDITARGQKVNVSSDKQVGGIWEPSLHLDFSWLISWLTDYSFIMKLYTC